MVRSKPLLNLISLSIGLCTYLYIFGVDFLFSKTTFFYHFDHPLFLTGYLAFINDSWHFPLGVTDNIYPGNNFSIVWTDSIPIYAIILKLIKTVTGLKIVNPFPIWYLICFLMSSYYLGKIFQIKAYNLTSYILSVFLIINTPLMINRMIFHSALSAHWLIIASVYFYIINEENNYENLTGHSINTAISLYIHPYIFTIVLPIFIVSLIKSFILKSYTKNKVKSLILFFVSVTFYFGGVLTNFFGTSNSTFRRPDYINYGAEFNSFFCGENPVSLIDRYLWCHPPYTQIHHEGYAYLGVGIIFLIGLLILKPKRVISNLLTNKLLILVLSLMLLYSFGNKWKIAHVQFFEFQPVNIHLKVLEVFRSTGRYTWAFYYFLAIYVILNLYKLNKKFLSTLILVFALTLQFGEAYNVYPGKSGWFTLNEIPTKQIEIAKSAYLNNSGKTLHVFPDERCTSMPQADHYIVALEYLNQGGVVHSTRTSRLLIDFDFCKNYTIEKSLEMYKPYHFVINDILLIEQSKYDSQYNCTKFNQYIHEDSNPAYCTK